MSEAPSRTGDAAEALRDARRQFPEAADLLNALAHLDQRPVPLRAIRAAAPETTGDHRDAVAPGAAGSVLSALEEVGVLRREASGVHLREEAAEVLRSELVRPVAAGAADAAAAFLDAWRERLEGGRGDEDDEWERLAAHAVSLAKHTSEAGRAPDRALRIGTRAAGRLQDRSRPRETARLLSALLEAGDAAPRLREPFLLAALEDQRAGLLAELDRSDRAADAAARAVRRAEEVCAEEDLRRAVLLHNVGGTLKRLGRLQEAIRCYDRAYGLLDEHHDSGTPLELQLCLDLSDVLLAREESGRAAEVAGRAVALARERLGRNHPETAAAVSNLGRAFRGQGRLGRAATAFEQAIQILEEVYDADHPALGPDLSNLGATLEEQGEVERARALHERALGIFRATYGERHRLTRAARAYLDDL